MNLSYKNNKKYDKQQFMQYAVPQNKYLRKLSHTNSSDKLQNYYIKISIIFVIYIFVNK